MASIGEGKQAGEGNGPGMINHSLIAGQGFLFRAMHRHRNRKEMVPASNQKR